jgi:hypothetical protein
VTEGPLDVVAILRAVAAGREEYADRLPETGPMAEARTILMVEAAAYRAAARIADGDVSSLWSLLPSWRWTPDMMPGTVGDVPVSE